MILPPLTSTLFPYTTLFRSAPGFGPLYHSPPPERIALLLARIHPRLGAHHRKRALQHLLFDIQRPAHRSEEHTSELQSHSDLVCRLLLEKKKKNKNNSIHKA